MNDFVSVRESELAETQEAGRFESPRPEGRLTNEQGIKLLRKLVADGTFRERFEKSPAAALIEIGVSPETISTLNEKCIPARLLAPNEVLQMTLEQLERGVATECLSMLIPNVKLHAGRS